MKPLLAMLSIIVTVLVACAQPFDVIKKEVGGPCEGCEAIFETPVPFLKLPSIDTMPDYHTHAPKLEISGTVFKKDGKTPAANVVVYAYHTDQSGRYPKRGNETGWGKRHGYIRAWVKTDEHGAYKFLTNQPAAYPGEQDPAHIHLTIKEPDKNEYYLDDIVFDDDPLLTKERRKSNERGGSGIVILRKDNGILYAKRDIYLGKNIPDYPAN